jgi:hypothetical protein
MSTLEELKAALAEAQAHFVAMNGMVDSATADVTLARDRHTKACGQLDLCRAASDAAADAHAAAPEPDEKLLATWSAARLALEGAVAREQRAADTLAAAQQAATTASAALRRAGVEASKAQLWIAAHHDTLQQAIAKLWAKWFSNGDVRALEAVGSAFISSSDAAEELSALGEDIQPLDLFHAMLPALERAVADGRAFPVHLHHEVDFQRGADLRRVGYFKDGFVIGVQKSLERLVPRPADHVQGLANRIAAMKAGARTMHDIERAVTAADREREAAARAAYRVPAGPRSRTGEMSFNPPREPER